VFVGGAVADARTLADTPAPDALDQARAGFHALAELLDAAGGGMADVIDLVTFHDDARTIEPVFEIGREHLTEPFPAWTPVAVSAHDEPGTRFALSAIAHLGPEEKEGFVPDTIKWWRRYPSSAGCRKGKLLAVAGQHGSDADGNVNTPANTRVRRATPSTASSRSVDAPAGTSRT
jgi:enamine deaminase RidA (YjgF/YER057c/UK114 family)